MRNIGHWLVTLALVLFAPHLIEAQALAPADLAGTWVRTVPVQKDEKHGTEVDTLVVRADSMIWRLSVVVTGDSSLTSRWGNVGRQWSVASDSLWLESPAAPQVIQGKTVIVGGLPNRVTLKGQELTIMMPIGKKETETYVYQRISTATPWP